MSRALSRRSWLAAVGAIACARRACSQNAIVEEISPATNAAILRGLGWLASRQEDDGSFGGDGYGRNTAVCSLAGLAFLAEGSVPGRGKFGRAITKSLSFVLSAGDESGFLSLAESASHGPMYDHGFATLFLAETYGLTSRGEVRERLAKAVKLIVAVQNKDGGWRYHPRVADADISVTICQVTALRAARNAGLFVPAETIERAVRYIKRCQNADGGFMYMLEGGPSKFPRSAAGVCALFNAGVYDGPEVKKGLEYLRGFLPKAEDIHRDTHSVYGQYYAAQVMWQAGGDDWKRWYPAVRDAILAVQEPAGSWPDPLSLEYGAAMNCLILQLPNNLLPIFQR